MKTPQREQVRPRHERLRLDRAVEVPRPIDTLTDTYVRTVKRAQRRFMERPLPVTSNDKRHR